MSPTEPPTPPVSPGGGESHFFGDSAREAATVGAPLRGARPTRIGPYRILEVLGEGGMGMVYLAEQEHPIHRRVALKVIKLGMDTEQVVARFEAERQALAMLDHPNVATVYEAGATEDGRPYFAMEHVAGAPITDYCDRHRLSTRERLGLFVKVCDAVQHAHQKAIIHRDIKPSNILVMIQNGRPEPKVIDFGVAKATSQRLTERTLFTEQGVLIGTPEYMSPEQAEMSGLNIDTRSDIYSLGVVLYELLVGALPFDSKALRAAGFGEIQRIIREDDPPRPSTRLSSLGGDKTRTVADRRRTDVVSLQRELKGDLDWIVMKAMEKDRTRRYASASEFAADVQRHLTDEMVEARPPSAAYRARKFVRRHRAGATAAALVVVALVVGVAGTVWQAVRATHAEEQARGALVEAQAARDAAEGARAAESAQRREAEEARGVAEREAAAAEAANQFLQDMLASADPESGFERDVTVREILDEASRRVAGSFEGRPLIEASLRRTLGNAYRRLAEYERAKTHLTAALETRRRDLGPEHSDTLDSMHDMGLLYEQQGDLVEAERIVRQALETRRRTEGESARGTLVAYDRVASVMRRAGDVDEAERLARIALDGLVAAYGPDDPDTLEAKHELAMVMRTKGRLQDAGDLLKDVAERRERVLGPEHIQTLKSVNQYAGLLKDLGQLDDAAELLERTLEVRRRELGVDHPSTLSSLNQLAIVRRDQGNVEKAEELMRAAYEGYERRLGPEHSSTLTAMNNLATVYLRQGRHDEAEPLFRKSLEARRRLFGPEHFQTLAAMNNLATVLREQKKYEEALPMYVEALEAHRRVRGDTHFGTLIVMSGLGVTLTELGRFDEAAPLMRECHEGMRGVYGVDHAHTKKAREDLAGLYERWGRPEMAAEVRAEGGGE